MKKIKFISVLPDGKDPDDFIKQNGKDGLLNLLKDKQIIQSFIWNFYLNKIDQNNLTKFQNLKKRLRIYVTQFKMKL